MRKKLNGKFKQKKNKHHAKYVFLKIRQLYNETTNGYAARLRDKTNDCEFEANCDERILKHLIQTTQNREHMGFDTVSYRCCSNRRHISSNKGMKIPQDGKNCLGDISRSGVHPKTHKAVRKNNPVDTADKPTHTRKARTAQRMETKIV